MERERDDVWLKDVWKWRVNLCEISHLNVFVFWQAGRDWSQHVIVQVKFPQVRHVGQRAVLHHTDLIVAQTQPENTHRVISINKNCSENENQYKNVK